MIKNIHRSHVSLQIKNFAYLTEFTFSSFQINIISTTYEEILDIYWL